MSSWALGEDGDLLFNKQAPVIFTSALETKQNIETRVKEQVFDCFFNQNAGIDWINLPKTITEIKILVSQIKNIISSTANVLAVIDEDYTYNNVDSILSVTVTYKTIFSDENVSQFLFNQ